MLEAIYALLPNNNWKPLPWRESKLIRDDYLTRLKVNVGLPPQCALTDSNGVVLAYACQRVVVGDYGPYIEFNKRDLNLAAFQQKWPGEPKRPVKYIWWESKRHPRVKLYEQRDTVAYADYLVDMWYISPADLYIGGARKLGPLYTTHKGF
jgi:hypothetical protein